MYMEHVRVSWERLGFLILACFMFFGIFIGVKSIELEKSEIIYEQEIHQYAPDVQANKEILKYIHWFIASESFFEWLVRRKFNYRSGYKYIWFESRILWNVIIYKIYYSIPNSLGIQSQKSQEFIFSSDGELLLELR